MTSKVLLLDFIIQEQVPYQLLFYFFFCKVGL